jgi:hypothetical protein
MFGLILLAAGWFAACQPMNGVCETPVMADSIADSVGVNIHLHYNDTVYGNFPLVKHLLAELGVRHTRDGLVDSKWEEYYQRHIALGQMGIRCLFITSPTQSSALLTSWPSRVPGAFEGYEGPNEYDLTGDPNWVATLRAFVQRLSSAVKSNPATAHFPVIGPSLTKTASYPQVAGLNQYFDFDNMHNYFGGRNPGTPGWGAGGYGSYAYNISNERTAWPGKPIWTTETGYTTDTSILQGIPELVAGKYMPRMILEQALHGIARTYIYELIDEGRAIGGDSGAFGLARTDGSRKPAFTALKSLIAILADPGPQILLPPLQFSLVGASSNVHHLVMAKRDGSYYVAFWLEEQDYDVNKRTELPVNPEKLTFVSGREFKTSELITLSPDGSLKTVQLTPSSRISLTATDCLTILRLD